KTIVKYYKKPESRWGYRHYLWGAKHFGFYPSKKADISEREAQVILQDMVAERLGLKKGQKVMDAGCGEGVVAVYLAKKYGVDVTGLTLVPFERTVAEKRAKDNLLTKETAFIVRDYTSTGFESNSFDAIYTTESLSHIPEPADALKEFYRLLKPGGRLALFEYTIAADEQFSKFEMEMLDLVIKESGMFGLKTIRHNTLTNKMSAVGFKNVTQQNVTDNIKPSFRRLFKSAQGPYRLVSRLGIRKTFINTTASVEYYKMAQKDLIRYYIFSAAKPK
ncbi:MAG TPA: methyltransferase domain-containing protein, partial [Candidatus Binatia bacterium]|nr:methyltransferase domain-containing protein [Candidatus Binatia bacterium]